MSDKYVPVRISQLFLLKDFPLYYFSKQEEPVLYKLEGDILDSARIENQKIPDLFIKALDREKASDFLYETMNTHLAQTIFPRDWFKLERRYASLFRKPWKDL